MKLASRETTSAPPVAGGQQPLTEISHGLVEVKSKILARLSKRRAPKRETVRRTERVCVEDSASGTFESVSLLKRENERGPQPCIPRRDFSFNI
ncbi:hypothetical protein GWI33_002656 [Rhynchophorus ferrugineus]|uniref:Uncharacterized protein n=1 Tax=Rhynchophorus ferrugineus TaxID=354439 RepID=A0A834IM94_RHYFE|nr:hypothetical protein GWI33_002656 [Rhynchophorus ferrugineus]